MFWCSCLQSQKECTHPKAGLHSLQNKSGGFCLQTDHERRCWLVLGISRLKSASTPTLFDENLKEAECKEVAVHQRFITDSASLFLIYFLQMVVMAMYLTQEQLKLIPLLTIVFAFGRLVYWGAAAFGSSIRGFGFGLSFLPGVVMMAANFYFIFLVEADGSIFSAQVPPVEVLPPPSGKQRFWG